MDTRDGKLYTLEEAKAMRGKFGEFLEEIDFKKLTEKQKREKRVSLQDHRSPTGKQLTSLRGKMRNRSCPCGSGKKTKKCCARAGS